jgi:PAS domain S-box-containing protein
MPEIVVMADKGGHKPSRKTPSLRGVGFSIGSVSRKSSLELSAMNTSFRLLMLVDQPEDYHLIERYLHQQGLTGSCQHVVNLAELKATLARQHWDIVLVPFNGDIPAIQATSTFLSIHYPDLPLILLASSLGEEKTVELLKLGVWDFVNKDNVTRLVSVIERSRREAAGRRARHNLEAAWHASEIRYHSLFENMLNGFAYCRIITEPGQPPDFVYIAVNRAFETLTGLSNVTGRRASEVIPGIQQSDLPLLELYERVAQGGISEKIESYVAALQMWFAISVYCPEPDHFVTVFDVITERKQAEAALRESETAFRMLAESMPQLVWICLPDGLNVYFNHQWVEYTGLSLAESRGTGWIVPFHPDDRQLAWDAWRQAAQNGGFYGLECRLRRLDGHYRWWLIRGIPQRNASGEILKWYGTCTDINDLKHAETALRGNQAILAAALASMTDAVFICDENSHFIEFNDAFATFHRFKNKSECARQLSDYTEILDVFLPNGELLPLNRWAVPRALQGETVANVEYSLRRKDTGETWMASYSFGPIRDEAGMIVGAVVVGRDITEHKQAEQKIRESESRYRQLFELESDAVVLIDCDTRRILDVNRSAQQLYGYSRQEFFQLQLEELSDEPELTKATFSSGNLHGDNIHIPLRWHRRKNGERFAVEITDSLLEFQGNRMRLAAIRDITERQRVTEILEETTGQLLESQRIAGLGSYVFDVKTGTWTSTEILDEIFGIAGFCFTKDVTGWLELIHPLDRVEMQRYLADVVLKGHAAFDRTYRIIRQNDHQERWVHGRGKLILNDQGECTQMLGTIQDVTERKRVEEVLRITQFSVDQSNDAIFWLTPNGAIVRVNQAASRLVNYSTEALMAMKAPDLDPMVPTHAWTDLRQKKVMTIETSFRAQDGRLIPVEVRSNYIKFENQEFNCAFVHDITERRQKTEELRWKTAFLEALVYSSPDGIMVTDNQGRKILQNQSVADLWKIPPAIANDEDAQVQRQFILKQTKDPAYFNEKSQQILFRPDEIIRDEIELIDGSVLELYTSQVKGLDGKSYGRFWTFRDLTKGRLLETQLRQAQKLEAIGTLAGGIAHDFNNILAAMFGYTYLLEQDMADNAEARENLAEILKAANRAKDLVQQILTFSRQREQKRQVVVLPIIIKEVMKFLRASLPSNIRIELNLSPDAPPILADPTQIHQVTMNLATNALHAMENRAGTLTVRLDSFVPDESFLCAHPKFQSIPHARLTLVDTGQGMDAKTLERIFEPFFTTKPVGKGTGLGLSVVLGIVQSHQGHITVESHVGQGTTFCLYFPAQLQNEVAPEISNGHVVHGQGQNILILDDEPALTNMFKRQLQRLNYRVITTNNAREAIQIVRECPAQFDLVITDLTMPEIDGLEVGRQLHRLRPDLPIMLASGFHSIPNDDTLREAGIREVLEKPVVLTVLADLVQRTLAKPLDGAVH